MPSFQVEAGSGWLRNGEGQWKKARMRPELAVCVCSGDGDSDR
jgi:hypothetical protein